MSDSTSITVLVPKKWWSKFRVDYRTLSTSGWLIHHLMEFIKWDPSYTSDKRWPAYIYKAELRKLKKLSRDPFQYEWICGGRYRLMRNKKQVRFVVEGWLKLRVQQLLNMLDMTVSELIRDVLEDTILSPESHLEKNARWELKYRNRNKIWKKKGEAPLEPVGVRIEVAPTCPTHKVMMTKGSTGNYFCDTCDYNNKEGAHSYRK